ncbi:hypothetical protein EIO00_06400 [Thermomonospora catenispora]|nr:hypothetical protein EIO00_06400 [Thermomonospora catenispora]
MDARAALARARALQERVRHRSRWYARFLWLFGAGSFVTTLLLAFGTPVRLVAAGLWGALVIGLSVYAVRQPVARHGFGVRHGVVIGVWATVYAVVVTVGVTAFDGDLRWWLPGAVAVALPALIGARLEGRR